ncbi:MAG TPA: hypothetical protein VGN18_14265 [Jatrophihabitans sp.]|jgi:hypothetical protein|uniref:hypothetical protein n=1 Tax=Jatrophihabitans sp. TaxID=1932789 RepID=UPI002E026A53|nr:hypothetical protein [Jatrophihabitans sp.]
MSLIRDDARRHCADRRARASARPTPVLAPLTSAVVAVLLSVAVTLVLGLPDDLVVLVGGGVALVAAVLGRRTVESLVAGAGMRLAQPYSPGEQVRLFVPTLHSVVDAEIVRVGPANTTLMVAGGLLVVPNSRMLKGAPEHPSTSSEAA